MNNIRSILEAEGLVANQQPNETKIASLTEVQIGDLVTRICEVTRLENLEPEVGIFSHSAAGELSGGEDVCSSISCRTLSLQKVAQFASFYSDRIYIPNFFSHLLPHGECASHENQNKEFRDNIELLLYLSPLLDSKSVVPVWSQRQCVDCARKRMGSSKEMHEEDILPELMVMFERNIKVTLELDNERILATVEGPIDLVHNGGFRTAPGLGKEISENSGIMGQLKKGEAVVLTTAQVKCTDICFEMAGALLKSVVYELGNATSLRTNFLFEKEIEATAFSRVTADIHTQQNNGLLLKHMACMVPFFPSINPGNCLELRSREPEAFVRFRGAILAALREYSKRSADFHGKDAEQIYHDIIAPQIASLDLAAKRAAKLPLKNMTRDIIAWTGIIGFGSAMGWLSSDAKTLAASIGAVNIGQSVIKSLIPDPAAIDDLKANPYYFLWKVKGEVEEKN